MTDSHTPPAPESGPDDEFERMTRIATSLIEADRRRRAASEKFGGQETSAHIYLAHAFLKYARSETEPRSAAALHACEGLDTVDLAKNDKGWLAAVVHGAARVESELTRALRARCPGNGDGDDDSVCECQSYEAGEQGAPCPPGCCVMAEEKDVRAILEAIERDEESPVADAPCVVAAHGDQRRAHRRRHAVRCSY